MLQIYIQFYQRSFYSVNNEEQNDTEITSLLQIMNNWQYYYYSDCCVIYYNARLTCVILLTRTSWGLRARVHGHASFYWSALPAPRNTHPSCVAWLSSHSSLRSYANWPQIVSSHPVIGVLSSEALNAALEGVMGWSTLTRVSGWTLQTMLGMLLEHTE